MFMKNMYILFGEYVQNIVISIIILLWILYPHAIVCMHMNKYRHLLYIILHFDVSFIDNKINTTTNDICSLNYLI